MKRIAVTSCEVFRDLLQNLPDISPHARKVTLVLEYQQPALLTVEMNAVPLEAGKVLTQTYKLVEIASEEEADEQPVTEEGCVDVTTLSDTSVRWEMPIDRKGNA